MKLTVLPLPAIGPNAIKTGFIRIGVIPGLGPKRRRDLLTHFGGIQGVLKASEKICNWYRVWVRSWPDDL